MPVTCGLCASDWLALALIVLFYPARAPISSKGVVVICEQNLDFVSAIICMIYICFLSSSLSPCGHYLRDWFELLDSYVLRTSDKKVTICPLSLEASRVPFLLCIRAKMLASMTEPWVNSSLVMSVSGRSVALPVLGDSVPAAEKQLVAHEKISDAVLVSTPVVCTQQKQKGEEGRGSE